MTVVFHIFCHGLWMNLHYHRLNPIATVSSFLRMPGTICAGGLGHNSKAVHGAYAKRALMKIPSLQDYEERMAIKTKAISLTNKTGWNLCKSLDPWFLNQTSERYANDDQSPT